jgi:hypothetical protein
VDKPIQTDGTTGGFALLLRERTEGTTEEETSQVTTLLAQLDLKLAEVLGRYPEDKRVALLKDTLGHLTRAIECHYRLMSAEVDDRLRLTASDYHEVLELYLPALRMFRSLPKSNVNSVYELGVVCTFDEVLVHHCEGQQ